MLSFKQKIAKNYINARGWRTNRKLLLIESDDWGAIRMPSKESFNRIKSENIPVDKLHIDAVDSLESSEDLTCLFETLCSFKDINNNFAVLTAYSVVANPDFEKIVVHDKKDYLYEIVTDTYHKYLQTAPTFDLILQGIQENVYKPQFHGREHIHVKRYMEAINSKSLKEKIAFNEKAIISSHMENDIFNYKKNYFAAFDYDSEDELYDINIILKDGLKLFEELFGYKSISFTAQGSVWGDGILETLDSCGIKLIGGQQLYPNENGNQKTINKVWGKKNRLGQIHWRRNCTFEPARNQDYDWVSRTLQEIAIAFRWGKPAVISSHRENFIGSIFPENRDQSLKKLKTLLKEVQKRWPDVEFIDTERLAHIMIADINK